MIVLTFKTKHRKLHWNLKTVMKIFLVTGLLWLADVISFSVTWAYKPSEVYQYLVIFDTLNALQGVILLVVLLFNFKTIKNAGKILQKLI